LDPCHVAESHPRLTLIVAAGAVHVEMKLKLLLNLSAVMIATECLPDSGPHLHIASPFKPCGESLPLPGNGLSSLLVSFELAPALGAVSS
jgi:hypothetical protein